MPRVLVPLSEHLWNAGIPLIAARSYGFIGLARIQVREHTIIESHPDNQNPDLRLDVPFPALKQYMDEIDLDNLDFKDHAHVPYLVPLYKALVDWKNEHNSELPRNYKEKELFRLLIRKG